MGNPKKPKHIKIAQGTLENSREIASPATGVSLSTLPAVPGGMGKDEEEFFIWACSQLLDLGLLTSQFIISIEIASMWWAEFCKAREKCRGADGMYTSQSGYTQISGWYSNMEKSSKLLNEFLGKYGLDLVSSQRISMPPRSDDSEIFD